jgi:hypothetical protein
MGEIQYIDEIGREYDVPWLQVNKIRELLNDISVTPPLLTEKHVGKPALKG